MNRIFPTLALTMWLLLFNLVPALAEETKPRIISLYAAHTEVLLRLGASENIIGVSDQETYNGPETEGWKPKIFSIRDDVEKFLAAKPDLVLARPMHIAAGSRLVETLENAGIKVLAIQVTQAAELYNYWRELGALVGRENEAERMIIDFDNRISVYHEAASQIPEAAKPGIFLEAIHDKIKTFTPYSLPVWLVELAGGRNVASDAKPHSPNLIVANYGPERLLSKADLIDIFISQMGPMNNTSLEQVSGRGIYKHIKAFKEGRVYKIPENIIARPTPSLLLGLEEIAGWTGLNVAGIPSADVETTPAVSPEPPAASAEMATPPGGYEEEEKISSEAENDLDELKVDLPPAQ